MGHCERSQETLTLDKVPDVKPAVVQKVDTAVNYESQSGRERDVVVMRERMHNRRWLVSNETGESSAARPVTQCDQGVNVMSTM